MILEVLMFCVGAVGASFVGVVASRIHTGLSYVKGRSRCTSCSKELSWKELIPIVSYLTSSGRCRSCSTRIPIVHPLSEALVGCAILGLFLMHGFSVLFFLWSLFVFVLLFLFLYDLAHMAFPTDVLYGAVGLSLIIALLSGGFILVALGSLVLTTFFYALYFFSRGRALGFGDVLLVLGLSLSVGSPAMWIGTLLSFWFGALVGIIVLFRKYGGIRMRVAIPFGPFLILGFLCAYFFEQPLSTLLGLSLGLAP